ncbi:MULTISPECIES: hypothetical protein [Nocardia]|uniref:Uncharacterized protein n=1 Tax=Nocardia aurea TaxID=2144174 RepID=A0ABV3FW07_9NOCA|nr:MULTISPECIES: hypothetical protein [Nocardia]
MRLSRSLLTRSAVTIGSVCTAFLLAAPTTTAAPEPSEFRIITGKTTLAVNPELGLDSIARFRVVGDTIEIADREITSGRIDLTGQAKLTHGDKTATVSDLSLAVDTGKVEAKINGKQMELGAIATDVLHLRKDPGENVLHLVIGAPGDNILELGRTAVNTLNTVLGTETITEGDELFTGTIDVSLPADPHLAQQLNADVDALVEASVDADTALDTPIDLGLEPQNSPE